MIDISPLLPEELEWILPIEKACHEFPSSPELLGTCFSKRYRNFKLVEGKKVKGFYMAEVLLDEMTLHNICVHPDCQGKGFGRQLFEHFVETARAHDVVQLWLEVRESNGPAIKLYQDNGFDVAGIRKNYYPAKSGREDAYLMGRALVD